ncbi:hypothetical protein KUV51_19400 [Tateyamaria omphalii]|uniref:hypothetical protein n=1 Tax=Tateyamaria omphalii TaxID=299262 RepID=UPI001C990E79|nr:hypothetical protein [Tateyamaria omphalii]MBY5935181.1 hypothetical protein [Tateyamaria omphalii]
MNQNQADLRSAVKIAVIDDEKFQPYSNLKSYGYDITLLHDISNTAEVSGYDIVLSDLMGVGAHFDQRIGGASLIKEIKTNYPTKIVIAYTGARANSAEAIAAKEYCDHFLKKDEDLTAWSEMLDAYVKQVMDPYIMWLNAREGLLDQEIDIRDIVKLEDAYVRSVQTQDADFKLLSQVLSKVNVSGHAKGIVQSLIASAIYSLILA